MNDYDIFEKQIPDSVMSGYGCDKCSNSKLIGREFGSGPVCTRSGLPVDARCTGFNFDWEIHGDGFKLDVQREINKRFYNILTQSNILV